MICADCVEVASEVLPQAPEEGGRELNFPPRVFGEPPDDSAVSDITESFRMVFGGAAGRPELREGHLEDAEEMCALLDAAGERNPGMGPSKTRVDRIRFVSPDLADVRFQIVLPAGGAFPFDGQAVRRDGGGSFLE